MNPEILTQPLTMRFCGAFTLAVYLATERIGGCAMKARAWFLAIAMAASGPAVAQTAEVAEASRTVVLELSEGGEIVAAPTLQMRIGRPTAVAAGDYSFRVRMERASTTDGASAPYVIRSTLYRADSGALVASPAVTVVEGQQASLRFAGQDGRNLSLAVLVR